MTLSISKLIIPIIIFLFIDINICLLLFKLIHKTIQDIMNVCIKHFLLLIV